MSHAILIGDLFWVKIRQVGFLYRLTFFITKNKQLTYFKIYTDFYTYRIELGEEFFVIDTSADSSLFEN
jgi:hypothetical protein